MKGSAQCFDGISISLVRVKIADGFFRLFHFWTWQDCPFPFAYLCVSVAISSAIEVFLVSPAHVALGPHRIIASQHLVGFFSWHLLIAISVSLFLYCSVLFDLSVFVFFHALHIYVCLYHDFNYFSSCFIVTELTLVTSYRSIRVVISPMKFAVSISRDDSVFMSNLSI